MLPKLLRLVPIAILLLSACSKSASGPGHATAPATFRVRMETSEGPVVIDVVRADSPLGADRFYNMVKAGYLDGDRFFRVVPGFVVQFGLAGDPAKTLAWQVPFPDEPVKRTNARGTLVYAKPSAPNSRTTQLFINLANNPNLDGMGFAPFGKIVSGMDAIDKIYAGYGENPDQDLITAEGNAYLQHDFPKLDYIKSAKIVSP